ncbi:MAG: HlyD family efflux transporter periplasmic adaptor subunit, partial [Acidobacteria bacterium]
MVVGNGRAPKAPPAQSGRVAKTQGIAMKKTSNRRLRSLVWKALVLAVLVAGVVLVLRPKAVPVDIAEATRGPLRVTLDQEGKTRVGDRFLISAPLAGRIQRIALEPGDRVYRNRTVLATIESRGPECLDPRLRSEAEARVRAMDSALSQARAERNRLAVELHLAETELNRSRRLLEKGLVAQASFDQAQSRAGAARQAVEAADAAIRVAGFELEAARARLVEPDQEPAQAADGTRLVRMSSPIDGVVLKRLRESEMVVPEGEPLLEIADLADLEIVADFLSADAVAIKPGMPAVVERWGGEAPLKGRVRRIEPAGFMKISALGVEEQRVNVIVDFQDAREAWDRVGDQYRVEVRVIVWESE